MTFEGKLVKVICTKRWGAPMGWPKPPIDGDYSINTHGQYVMVPIGTWVMIVSKTPLPFRASLCNVAWEGYTVCFMSDGRVLYTNDSDGFKW